MIKYIKYFILFFFLSAYFTAEAQLQGQARLDSLLRVLPGYKTADSNKVKLLLDIGFLYRGTDPHKALDYAGKGLQLAQQLKWERGVGKAYNTIGTAYKAQSDYPKALENFLKSLKIFESSDSRRDYSVVLMNIGTVYRPLKEYEKARQYYTRSLKVADSLDLKKETGQLYGNIAVTHYEEGHPGQATPYNLKALKIFEEINDKSNMSWILANLADAYMAEKDYEKALTYLEQAIKIDKELNSLNFLGSNLSRVGSIHTDMAATEKNAEKRSAHLSLAISYTNQALEILKDIDDPEYLKDIYLALSRAYELSGNHQAALANYKIFTTIKDTVYSTEIRESVAELETRRALEIKDREVEIAKLKKRSERLYLGSSIVVLALIGLSALLAYRKQKKTNKIVRGEKQKSEELLLNILPAEVANELKNTGSAAARHYSDVTVLFTDFVNFTTVAERLSPQALVDELHTCFKAFDAITSRYNIEKIKTVGDAYLAVAGLPLPDTNHAANVARAAIEIVAFMKARKANLGENAFEIRVGVNTGNVVAGIVGVKKFAYDIWGDTVNIASRMEQASEPGKINISEATYALVKDHFNCTYRGEVEVKNKGRLRMYFLEG